MMDMCGGVGQQKQRLQNMKIIVSSKDTANENATDTTPDEHIKKQPFTLLSITYCNKKKALNLEGIRERI